MFARAPSLIIQNYSPSHVPNNLTAVGSWCAFARKSEAFFVDRKSGTVTAIPSNSAPHQMTHVKLITVDGEPIAALLSTNGAEFWQMGEGRSGRPRLVSMIALDSLKNTCGPDELSFMRGVAVTGKENSVCIGCSSGDVLVLCPFGTNAVSRVVRKLCLVRKNLSAAAPVADLVGLTAECNGRGGGCSFVAGGDDDGFVRIWDPDSGLLVVEFPPPGGGGVAVSSVNNHLSTDGFTPRPPPTGRFPCTSLAVIAQRPILAAGYSTGLIRLFRVDSRELVCELGAHSRRLTALASHPTLPLLASVGEDTFMHVWNFPNLEDKDPDSIPEVELVYSDHNEDVLLCGVAFTHDGSQEVIAAAYDEAALIVWANTD